MWTMDELVDRVGQALAAEYAGAPNGRVRDVPDRRAVRWYATTGLVDRPSGTRGRQALYGPRHLLQLVAVKRRQAEGHTLAAIQAELQGADDAVLAEIARVPEELLTTAGAPAEAPPARARFWAASSPPAPDVVYPPHGTSYTALSPAPAASPMTEIGGVALGGGALLVLPVRPSPDDLAALAVAARPLIELLAARGLITYDDGSPS